MPLFEPLLRSCLIRKKVTSKARLRTSLFAILINVLGLAVLHNCCLYGFFELVYLNKYSQVSIFAKNYARNKMVPF